MVAKVAPTNATDWKVPANPSRNPSSVDNSGAMTGTATTPIMTMVCTSIIAAVGATYALRPGDMCGWLGVSGFVELPEIGFPFFAESPHTFF